MYTNQVGEVHLQTDPAWYSEGCTEIAVIPRIELASVVSPVKLASSRDSCRSKHATRYWAS